MPWVKEELCVGCGACVAQCPVDAIAMQEDVARIDEQRCIRCGTCHDVCPQDAVRHDGERIPAEVDANLEWAKSLLEHYKTPEERQGFVLRVTRYFGKEKKVAEQTMQRLADYNVTCNRFMSET